MVNDKENQVQQNINMSNLNLQPPPPLSFDGNVSENWTKWKKKFETYLIATESDKKLDGIKIAIFMHTIGEDAVEKYETFTISENDKKSYDKIIEAFDSFCVPKKNESVCRYKFFHRKQNTDESFDDFLTELRKLSLDCSFGTLKDSLIRDQILSGINNDQVRERLLREENLDLEKSVKICKTAEMANQNIEALQGKSKEIDTVRRNAALSSNLRNNRGFQQRLPAQTSGVTQASSSNNVNKPTQQPRRPQQFQNNQQQQSRACSRCDKFHDFRQCPAFGKICRICNKHNHFANVCRSGKNVNTLENQNNYDHSSDGEDETYLLSKISLVGIIERCWYESLTAVDTNKSINIKLDTGAECNVLKLQDFRKLGYEGNLNKTTNKLLNYDDTNIQVLGTVDLKCKVKNKIEVIRFYVVNKKGTNPVLGLPTIKKLGLIARVANVKVTDSKIPKILEKYKDTFSGIGKIVSEYDFQLKDGSVGKIEPCRKVPFKLMDAYKKELIQMVKDEIITAVDEPTEFVNPIVIVMKPDKSLRICLDPQHLNSCLMREHFKLPTFEEVTSKMAGSTVFSILDASKAFWQIKLTGKSSYMTTFNTPFGRYRFLRMPYGIKTAPEVFHKTYKEIFKDIENVEVYIDDIIIYAKDINHHNQILEKVLNRAESSGVKFKEEKLKLAQPKVKFLGHEISAKGIEPDSDKIKAIEKMKKPEDAKAVERLLGFITYVGKFIENLSEVTAPLRNLIKKNTPFIWTKEHDSAFFKIKKELCNKPILQFYDVNIECKISVDASSTGVGAVLLQNNLPIAYASQAFTSCQQSWAQIEKECYAIVFGCERFRQYVIGRYFQVESDHKPLIPILKKNIADIPTRLQKMRMRLQPYDFNVIYTPGKDLMVADALSRAHVAESREDVDPKMYILDLTLSNNMSNRKKLEYIQETAADEELQTLKKFIHTGWPAEIKDVPNIIKAYHTYYADIYEYDGLLFKNDCLIVPTKLRNEVLEKLHYNHLGIDKTKSRAREIVFWPGMNREIVEKVTNCKTCLKFKRSNQKETLIPSEIPDRPWETVGADLYYLYGNVYLLVIDYYSKYVDVLYLKDESSTTTIKALKTCFTHWGIPKTVRSDGGPQYKSEIFNKFSKEWNFEHIKSSPTHAPSNGMVERHIQTVKKTIKKAVDDKKDVFLALLELNNTPIDNSLGSPNLILQGRKVRGVMAGIPLKEDEPNLQIKHRLQERQLKQKKYHDQRARDLLKFEVGQNVRFKNRKGTWDRAIVIDKNPNQRAYQIQTDKGKVLIRNRIHLNRDTNEPIHIEKDRSYDANTTETLTNNNDTPVNIGQQHEAENLDAREWSNGLDQGGAANAPQQVVFTRSGRASVKPKYLKDYI